MKNSIHGVVPPMVTPLRSDGSLDAEGTERLVEHILAGDVHGLFLLGTTGEAPDLAYGIRCELVERVCRQVNGRVPVLVGITDTVFAESLKMAEFAKTCGASALVAAPPYYFAAGQPELIAGVIELIDCGKVSFDADAFHAAHPKESVVLMEAANGIDIDVTTQSAFNAAAGDRYKVALVNGKSLVLKPKRGLTVVVR